MRELKFRFYSQRDDGKWSVHESTLEEIEDQDSYQGSRTWKRKAVCQFTGLTDKNGVEIYEGDIVKLGQVDRVSIAQEETFTNYKVIFGTPPEAHFGYPSCFYLHTLDTMNRNTYGEGTLFCRGWHSSMEVIGNIYEHKHLLEGKK